MWSCKARTELVVDVVRCCWMSLELIRYPSSLVMDTCLFLDVDVLSGMVLSIVCVTSLNFSVIDTGQPVLSSLPYSQDMVSLLALCHSHPEDRHSTH